MRQKTSFKCLINLKESSNKKLNKTRKENKNPIKMVKVLIR